MKTEFPRNLVRLENISIQTPATTPHILSFQSAYKTLNLSILRNVF